MNFKTFSCKFASVGMAISVLGCTHDTAYLATDFVGQKLGGKIAGKPWTAKYAYVDPTISTPEEDDYVFVFLAFKPGEPCPKDPEDADSRSVLVSAPKSTGKPTSLKKGSSRNLVFHMKNKAGSPVTSAAVTGKIKLTAIDARTVKGKVMGALNDKNYVNGEFTATVCELGDMDKASPWD